jgi:hypothetical protein
VAMRDDDCPAASKATAKRYAGPGQRVSA